MCTHRIRFCTHVYTHTHARTFAVVQLPFLVSHLPCISNSSPHCGSRREREENPLRQNPISYSYIIHSAAAAAAAAMLPGLAHAAMSAPPPHSFPFSSPLSPLLGLLSQPLPSSLGYYHGNESPSMLLTDPIAERSEGGGGGFSRRCWRRELSLKSASHHNGDGAPGKGEQGGGGGK